MVKNIVQAVGLTVIDSATFTGAYQAINPNGLEEACFFLRIINDSTVDVTVSYDGVIDHDYVQTTEIFELPAQTNSQPNNFVANFKKGQVVYVKAAAGVGFVMLAGYYQPRS